MTYPDSAVRTSDPDGHSELPLDAARRRAGRRRKIVWLVHRLQDPQPRSYKLDPGASFSATGRGIYFVLSGGGSVAGDPFRRLTAV